MKNKAKLIDINILSSYMGRWLTWLVSAIVLALALSALWGGRGGFAHGSVAMCLYERDFEEDATERFSFLRIMLANRTRKSVSLISEQAWRKADILVIPQLAFLRIRDQSNLVPLVYLRETPEPSDQAVLISDGKADYRDFSQLSADDVLFLNPGSMNGFLVQLMMLEKKGFKIPRQLSKLRFAGKHTWNSAAVVFRVLKGEYKMGACKESDLRKMVSQGVLEEDDISIVASYNALPEMIIACPEGSLEYFEKAFMELNRRFQRQSANSRGLVIELARTRGIYGFEPISGDLMNEVAGIYERFY